MIEAGPQVSDVSQVLGKSKSTISTCLMGYSKVEIVEMLGEPKETKIASTYGLLLKTEKKDRRVTRHTKVGPVHYSV